MFCHNCGKEIPDGVKFCTVCGAEITNLKNNAKKYDGEMKKCPNCGELLNAFETKCSACGYEIRNAKASSAIEEFTRKLTEIDNYKSERKVNLKTLIQGDYGYELEETKKINEMKCNYIKSFAIPNTKEDLYEFLIMATSNLDANYLVKKKKDLGMDKEAFAGYKRLNEAWYAKMEQAYEKAKLAFNNDEDFTHISEMFLEKQNEIKKAKKKKFIKKIIIWGIIIGIIILGAVNNYIEATKVTPEDLKGLQKVEEYREEDIMPMLIKDCENADFNKFNSHADENGLGGTKIYTDGTCESVFSLEFDNGIIGYIMILKINENQKWLVHLDSDKASDFDVYKKLENHKVCVRGIYEGYSDVYKMPSVTMKQVYDYNDGILITSGTFLYYEYEK